MSARLVRKVLAERELQKNQKRASEEGDEEEKDDSSSPISTAPSRNPFDLLDDQQEDRNQEDEVEALDEVVEKEISLDKQSSNVIPTFDNKSKKNKKKKKKKKNKEVPASGKKKDEKSIESILEDLSITPTTSVCQTATKESKANDGKSHLKNKYERTSYVLTVDPKHLKAENELRKIFGSKVVNSVENRQNAGTSRHVHGGRRTAYNPRKTMIITPSNYWPRWDGSLSMDLLETKGGVHYFRYTHSQSYMYVQEAFEAAKAMHDINAIASILAHHPYHIEALLTFAELFKFSGEHQSSADAIGKCLFALECAWHPLFISLDGNSQLKYSHDTNKPFFKALFSHMKNMDRRGCHRSALEVCKLLLSLDSDDPMGALFCVDYFSLRAQEFAWLEQFSEEYKSDSSMWLFPNFSYSLAVCRFYIEQEANKEGFVETDKATSSELMKQALMLHPLVLKKLVDKAPLKDSAWVQILKSSFFGYAESGSPSLEHLINIYVERNYLIWRFPELQNLLKQAALEIIESLKNNDVDDARDWACIRREAFSSEKNEYSHLMVADFSDTVASIPPEELRQFMGGGVQHLPHEMQDVDANPEIARDVREVAGRNPAVVFLESLLPWMDYGANGNGHQQNGDNQDIQE